MQKIGHFWRKNFFWLKYGCNTDIFNWNFVAPGTTALNEFGLLFCRRFFSSPLPSLSWFVLKLFKAQSNWHSNSVKSFFVFQLAWVNIFPLFEKRKWAVMLQCNSASSAENLYFGRTQLLKSTAKHHDEDSFHLTLLVKWCSLWNNSQLIFKSNLMETINTG